MLFDNLKDNNKNYPNNILLIDLETTGFSPISNDLITGAFLIHKDGEPKAGLDLKSKPIFWENINQQATEVHGITTSELLNYPDIHKAFNLLISFFKANKVNKLKPIIAGHNVAFDIRMLNSFWAKAKLEEPRNITSQLVDELSNLKLWVYTDEIYDTKILANFVHSNGIFSFKDDRTGKKNLKLSHICEKLSIIYNSHNALDDILATAEVASKLNSMINKNINIKWKFEKELPLYYHIMVNNLI